MKTKKSREDRRNGINATNFRGLKLKCYEVKTQKEKASRGFWELNRIETINEPLERELKRFNGEFNRFTFLIFPSVVLPATFAMSITTNKSNKTQKQNKHNNEKATFKIELEDRQSSKLVKRQQPRRRRWSSAIKPHIKTLLLLRFMLIYLRILELLIF